MVFEYCLNKNASKRIIELILNYVNVDVQFSNGQTPLLIAISNNQYDIVNLLLSKGASLKLSNNEGENPLIYICKYSHFHDIMGLLLKYNANFNMKDKKGKTAVMYAINTSNLRKLRLLLNHSYVSTNAVLKLILCGKNKMMITKKQIREIMINDGNKYKVSITDNDGENALISACKTRNESIIDAVLDYCLVKNKNIFDRQETFKTFETYYNINILLWAVINNYKKMVESLFQNGYDKSITDEYGNSLLMLSVINNKKEMIELLMKYDADICRCNRDNSSPIVKSLKFTERNVRYIMEHSYGSSSHPTVYNFYKAVWSNNLNFLYKCLKIRNRSNQDIDLELDEKDCDIFTLPGCNFDCALTLAILSNHSLPQLLLINYYKKYLSQKHRDNENRNWYSLLYAAEKGNEIVVDFILGLGLFVNINVKNHGGDTPLMLASKYGHESIVYKLINRNATIDKQNKNYDTALSLASANGYEKVVELLLCNNADMTKENTEKKTALSMACENGYVKVVNMLVRYGRKGNVLGENEINTLLLKASEYGYLSIVETLITDPEYHINLNVHDKDRNTSLILATEKGHIDIVELLLNYKADIESKNCDLNTALLIACNNGNESLVKLLLSHKANRNSRNRYGFTPYFIALKRGYPSIANLIRSRFI
ncbi:ankyrin [Piromyces finnis]|uniref:Ankyrin n=1 Tax=Piromyces finnis TaxID=1754191 RepID=A0A1Y1VII6_9FUNG|nr:ankyrin [Piromyces finnis]|eukprot:ORX57225.1 ankyrin [Piromyces finnis]